MEFQLTPQRLLQSSSSSSSHPRIHTLTTTTNIKSSSSSSSIMNGNSESSSVYWIQQHMTTTTTNIEEENTKEELEYWKTLVSNALHTNNNHNDNHCCDIENDDDEKLPSVISTTHHDDDNDDESNTVINLNPRPSTPLITSKCDDVLDDDDENDSNYDDDDSDDDDDDDDNDYINNSIIPGDDDDDDDFRIPFLSLPTEFTIRTNINTNQSHNKHNNNHEMMNDQIIPSHIVFRTKQVVQTMGYHHHHHDLSTTTTTTMIPSHIYIQQDNDNDNHNDDDTEDMVVNDAIEIITFDPTRLPLLIQEQPNYYSEQFVWSTRYTKAVQQMYTLLLEYNDLRQHHFDNNDDDDDETDNDRISMMQCQIRQLMQQYPTLCQIRFVLPLPYVNTDNNNNEETTPDVITATTATTMKCYLLTYFVIWNWFEGVQITYDAYPEVIGQYQDLDFTPLGGCIPLHYACYYYHYYHDHDNNTNNKNNQKEYDTRILHFLLQCYPDAIRTKSVLATWKAASSNQTHSTAMTTTKNRLRLRLRRQPQQLPIHILCQYCRGILHPNILQLLLHYYPMSMQIHDGYGYTPLMYLCCNSDIDNIVEIITLILESTIRGNSDSGYGWHQNCTILRSVTNTDTMEYVLHLVTTYHLDRPELIQLFIDIDPMLCQYTNMKFQLPIHTAVLSFCQYVISVTVGTEDRRIAAMDDEEEHVIIQTLNRMIETIQLLADTYPASLQWRDDDDHDETPGMIAKRLLQCNDKDDPLNYCYKKYCKQILDILFSDS